MHGRNIVVVCYSKPQKIEHLWDPFVSGAQLRPRRQRGIQTILPTDHMSDQDGTPLSYQQCAWLSQE